MGILSMVSGLPQFKSLVERSGWAWVILERHQKHGEKLTLKLQLNIGLKWVEGFLNSDFVKGTGKLTL